MTTAPTSAVEARVRVATLDKLKAKGVVVVHGDDRPIAVFYNDGDPKAVDNRCPHMGFPMHQGTVRGGIVTCVDIADGSTVWQKRIGGNFSASPICVDGNIYCADDGGAVYVIAAADQFKLLAKNDLGHPTRATGAVGDGALFFRTYSNLFCIAAE